MEEKNKILKLVNSNFAYPQHKIMKLPKSVKKNTINITGLFYLSKCFFNIILTLIQTFCIWKTFFLFYFWKGKKSVGEDDILLY